MSTWKCCQYFLRNNKTSKALGANPLRGPAKFLYKKFPALSAKPHGTRKSLILIRRYENICFDVFLLVLVCFLLLLLSVGNSRSKIKDLIKFFWFRLRLRQFPMCELRIPAPLSDYKGDGEFGEWTTNSFMRSAHKWITVWRCVASANSGENK